MSEVAPEQQPAEITQEEFVGKILEFIQSAELINNRLTEIEGALAYLLMKDPEWLKSMEAKIKQEQEDAAQCQPKDSEGPAQGS